MFQRIALLEQLDLAKLLQGFGQLRPGRRELGLKVGRRGEQIVAPLDRRLGEGGVGIMVGVGDAERSCSMAIWRSKSVAIWLNSPIIISISAALRRFSSTSKRFKRINPSRDFMVQYPQHAASRDGEIQIPCHLLGTHAAEPPTPLAWDLGQQALRAGKPYAWHLTHASPRTQSVFRLATGSAFVNDWPVIC